MASQPVKKPWFKPTPSPTPLPLHFPETDEISRYQADASDRSLETAITTCWPERNRRQELDEMREVPMSFAKLEALFGKVRRREQLTGGKLEIDAQHGLLFDASIFSRGAAGSMTELNGKINDLRVRAEGRNIACRRPIDDESHLVCECF